MVCSGDLGQWALLDDVLVNSDGLLHRVAAPGSKYEYLDSCKNDDSQPNPVIKMRARLAVSTSGFYDWLSRPTSATAARRQALTARVRHFTATHGTYGYRRIHANLAGEGTECSPELARQIMRAELVEDALQNAAATHAGRHRPYRKVLQLTQTTFSAWLPAAERRAPSLHLVNHGSIGKPIKSAVRNDRSSPVRQARTWAIA